jgi:lambda repressor-like predicted transcriptional regulator
VNPFTTRLKVLGATGILVGGLGAAMVSGAFTAPSSVAFAQTAPPTATATTGNTSPSGTRPNASGTPGARPFGPGRRGPGGFGFPFFGQNGLSSLASFFGMNSTDLQTALKNGQTLAQIAQAHGKSTDDLKNFLTSQIKTQLDQQVSSGKMTSQQETTILNKMSTGLDQLINNARPQAPAGGPGPGRGFAPGFARGFGGGGVNVIQTVAQALGMNASDVQSELRSGKTLTAIATEHGKSAADLKTALVNAYSAQVDKLLTATFPQRPAPAKNAAPTATPTATSG